MLVHGGSVGEGDRRGCLLSVSASRKHSSLPDIDDLIAIDAQPSSIDQMRGKVRIAVPDGRTGGRFIRRPGWAARPGRSRQELGLRSLISGNGVLSGT